MTLIILNGDVEVNPGPSDEHYSLSSTSSETLDQGGKLNLSFIHLNVRSLLPNLDQISIEFDSYDIIALTETFLDDFIDSDSD